MGRRPITCLCLASFFKGQRLLAAYKEMGCHTIVVATSNLQNRPWPRDAIDELYFVPEMDNLPNLLKAVSYLARSRRIDLVVPLEEYMVEKAAVVRGHLGCPGMCESTARQVRDKYTMRRRARECGIAVPDFELVLNHEAVGRFLHTVDPPWLLKPRSEGGAVQILKLHSSQDAWEAIHSLGDAQSSHLLESYVAGDVYHVDSITDRGEVLLAVANRYWSPPFDVWHGGGVFMSETVPSTEPVHADLLGLNRRILATMGVERGVSHVEFIRARDTGTLHFLEIGARVAGAHLDRLTLASTGVDLFREAARLELSFLNGDPYRLPETSSGSAGLVLCLSRDERPDLSSYRSQEIVWRLQEDHHAGLVLASPKPERIRALMEEYGRHFREEHLAVLPPAAKPA
ncbi:MAG: ATPase [Armatimonadetes bacterium]|nr:ATPase [Armatimonadota bacterium]